MRRFMCRFDPRSHTDVSKFARRASIAALAVALSAFPVAAGGTAPLSAAPDGIQGAGGTRLVIVNRNPTQSATVVAGFFKQGFASMPTSLVHPSVPPLASVRIESPPELSSGAYAVITSSDRAIEASTVTYWASSGGAIAEASPAVGQDVLVPLAMIRFRGQTSLLSVQNTDTVQVATVTIELRPAGETVPIVSTAYQIQPGSSITLDLSRNPSFIAVPPNDGAGGFLGSLRVTSAVEVAVHAIHDVENSQRAVHDHNGVPSERAAPLLHVPLVTHGPARDPSVFERTWIAVANAGTAPAQVRLTNRGFGGTCEGQTIVQGPRPLLPGAMTLFESATAAEPAASLPEGCLASATVESTDAPLAAAVVHLFASASAPAIVLRAAATLAQPTPAGANGWVLWRWHRLGAPDGGISEAIVHNPGANDAVVDLVPRDGAGIDVAGCGAPCRAVVPAGSTRLLRAEAADILPPDFTGSAVVRADQPVIVWLRDTFDGGASDETLSAAVPLGPDGGGGGEREVARRVYTPFFAQGRGDIRPTPPGRTATATVAGSATATVAGSATATVAVSATATVAGSATAMPSATPDGPTATAGPTEPPAPTEPAGPTAASPTGTPSATQTATESPPPLPTGTPPTTATVAPIATEVLPYRPSVYLPLLRRYAP